MVTPSIVCYSNPLKTIPIAKLPRNFKARAKDGKTELLRQIPEGQAAAFEAAEGIHLEVLRNRLISLGIQLRRTQMPGRMLHTKLDYEGNCVWCWWE